MCVFISFAVFEFRVFLFPFPFPFLSLSLTFTIRAAADPLFPFFPFSLSHLSLTLRPYLILSSYVSPRHRARRTLELLDIGCRDRFPWSHNDNDHVDDQTTTSAPGPGPESIRSEAKMQVTDAIREWDYGDYEGLTSAQIREQRRAAAGGGQQGGGDGEWDIWRDGCPGGESPADVTRRLDGLIKDIRERFHAGAMAAKQKEKKGEGKAPAAADVLLVAHGHILRAFAMRWIGRELTDGVNLLLEAGGVGTLSYEHGRIEEPAIL